MLRSWNENASDAKASPSENTANSTEFVLFQDFSSFFLSLIHLIFGNWAYNEREIKSRQMSNTLSATKVKYVVGIYWINSQIAMSKRLRIGSDIPTEGLQHWRPET